MSSCLVVKCASEGLVVTEEIIPEPRNGDEGGGGDLGSSGPNRTRDNGAPARTIAGLGVKARHAAYVTSQYWNEPIDKIDWDARAVRLLIEAVCDSAPRPLLSW